MAATLHLSAVDGQSVHGWLATLGIARVLSGRYPALALHWTLGEDATTPVLTGGPATLDQLVDEVYVDSIGRIPDGGVLPDCDPAYPPEGRAWYGEILGEPWPAEAELWMTSLATGSGLWLHPLVKVHAAQTVRRVLGKILRILRSDPSLLRRAIVGPGYGLTAEYPSGLWITATGPGGGDQSMASPGRDWLIFMGLPWMQPFDHDNYTISDDPKDRWRPTAPGWRNRRIGRDRHECVYEWRLWAEPVPASAMPDLLRLGDCAPLYLASATVRCGAVRRKRTKAQDPPYLDTVRHEDIHDGRLDDEYPELDSEQAVEWLRANGQPTMTRDGLYQAVRRARIARSVGEDGEHLCPEPAKIGGRSMWSIRQLRRWRPRGQGARTDRRSAHDG